MEGKCYPPKFCPDAFIYKDFPDRKFLTHTSDENVKDIENVEVDSILANEEKISEKISIRVCPDVLIYNSYPDRKLPSIPLKRMSKTLSKKILKMQLILRPFISVKRKYQNLSPTLSKRLS